MEIYRKDLAAMSRKERNRALDQMIQTATAHRDKKEPWLVQVLHAIRGLFVPGRAAR